LTELQAKAREETLDLKLAMLATGVRPTRDTALGRTRALLGESFNVGCICNSPGPEALAIFLGNVCETAADHIAVVVLADSSADSQTLADSIVRLESTNEGKKLPLLVHLRSASEAPMAVPAGRPVRDFTLPLTVEGLAKSLRGLALADATTPPLRRAA
jgi:hypothetical protein